MITKRPERTEHAFAQYVRILGKGKTSSRSLTQIEAQQAFRMILSGEVTDVQLGAFLMLLRVKEESAEELAGFVLAAREFIDAPAVSVDLDWPSYAGKRRQLPWYLLAALALADAGYRVFMHGAEGHTAGRVYSLNILQELGVKPCENWHQAAAEIESTNFAFMPLSALCKPLMDIIELRSEFGLRSPVHTLTRLINPTAASCSLQSVFHPSYSGSHHHAAALLKQPNAAVFKGEAGEVERKPEADTRLLILRNQQELELYWPRLLDGKQEWQQDLSAQRLKAFWRSDSADSYGEQAVLGTIAIALSILMGTDHQEEALSQAKNIWQHRDLTRLS